MRKALLPLVLSFTVCGAGFAQVRPDSYRVLLPDRSAYALVKLPLYAVHRNQDPGPGDRYLAGTLIQSRVDFSLRVSSALPQPSAAGCARFLANGVAKQGDFERTTDSVIEESREKAVYAHLSREGAGLRNHQWAFVVSGNACVVLHLSKVSPSRDDLALFAAALGSLQLSEGAARKSLAERVLDDCKAVLQGSEGPDGKPMSEMVATLVCGATAKECRDTPGADSCRKLVRSFDAKRAGRQVSELFRASEEGDFVLVKQLLDIGYDPNRSRIEPAGWTPLLMAAAEGRVQTVMALLQGGADPDARNQRGRTGLMFASNYGSLDIVVLLLGKGAKPDIAPDDGVGLTALMSAARQGHADVVRALLAKGADKSLRDKAGKTALDHAESRRHEEAARLLR